MQVKKQMKAAKRQYMPQEIEVWYIIPSIRSELAKAMSSQGLKQKKIAELLGITEAAVSQYIKKKRARDVDFAPETMNEIESSSQKIIKDGDKLICEMQRLLRLVKKNKTLCRMHYRFGRMPHKCEACLNAE